MVMTMLMTILMTMVITIFQRLGNPKYSSSTRRYCIPGDDNYDDDDNDEDNDDDNGDNNVSAFKKFQIQSLLVAIVNLDTFCALTKQKQKMLVVIRVND